MNQRLLISLVTSGLILLSVKVLAQSSYRANYESLNVSQYIKERQLTNVNPNAAAKQLFSNSVEEGLRSEQLSVDYPNPTTAIVVHSVIGLPDDSVAGIRTRLEFKSVGNKWQLSWVGRQVRCQKNRGQSDWGSKRCR